MKEITYINPVLLIAVPLALAFIIPILKFVWEKSIKWIPVAGFLFDLIVSITLIPIVLQKNIIVKIGGTTTPFSINLVVGPAGLLLSIMISLAGFLVAIYALKYIQEGDKTKYHILFMLLLTGAIGVVLTGDIFNLFVFFEVLCISSYALVGYLGNRAGIESSIKYLIQGSIGSSLLLVGIGLIYGQYGTLNMADLAAQIKTADSISLFVPMFFMITGLGIEAAIFPLNSWLPDAHSSAPSSISAVLSGIAIEVGLYAMMRILFTIFAAESFMGFLLFLGVITLLIGEMSAFSQNNIKRMLAYSSIGQIGLIVFAFSIATASGLSGGFFQMISHTLNKALLFLATGFMIYRTGSMEISSFRGLGKKMPLTALFFTIGTFSIIGLPPFVGFASKFLIFKAALAKQELLFIILIAVIILTTVIEGAYFFRIIQTLYFKESDDKSSKQESAITALIPMFIFALLILILGIYPNWIMKFIHSAASELLNKMSYLRSVLG